MGRSRRGRRAAGKAITPGSVARAGGGTVRDISTDVAALTSSNATQIPGMARLLPTPDYWASMPFGPGRPIDPVPINPVRPDSGRPEPRLYEYPVSWNVTTTSQRLVPWSILRAAADGVSLFRRCIEVRKDHMIGLDWDVVISQDALDAAQAKADREERKAGQSSGTRGGMTDPPSDQDTAPAAAGRAAVEDDMRERLGPEIDAAKEFFRMPDRGNGEDFPTWLGKLLEEVFVLDALAIYPKRTLGGDLYSLEIVDGSTIKPLLDERGGRPLPPQPAYQQMIFGFPRGEFTASTVDIDGEDVITGAYPSDELIYLRRVARVWTPYGLSAVEQALDDGSLYLKRHAWMMSEYTDGTSVSGLFTTEAITGWSPEQLLQFEIEFNRMFSGSIVDRHNARFLPPGVMPVDQGPTGSDAIAEKYRPDYDLYLLKLVAMHFDTTLPELGFTDAAAGGLGASGYHEGQENVQMRKRLPIIKFVEATLTSILRKQYGAPAELEFRFLGLDDEDEPGAADVDAKRQAAGVITLNELRDSLGRTRYAFPEADMPFVSTGRGLVFLEGSSALEPPGTLVGPPEAAPAPQPGEGDQLPGNTDAPAAAKQPEPAGAGAPGKPTATAVQKAAELTAYRRWASKGVRGRAFRWEHHDEDEVAALLKAAEGGDAGPKAGAPWPGWKRDLLVAAEYEGLLVRALTGAVGAQTLATRWLEHGAGSETAEAWAREALDDGARIAASLTPVIHRLWTEGYLIGDISGGHMLERLGPDVSKAAEPDGGDFDHETAWGDWTPGDSRAAAAILRGAGRYPGLEALLDSGDVTIQSIARHRVAELVKVLAQAADEGWSNGRTARALRDVLEDARWARMVAITEGTRASSAAALGRYRDHGVSAKSWMTAADQRVCPECHENEAEGDIPLSSYFQSGDDAPPGHPVCRCAPAPGWLPTSDAEVRTSDLVDA